MLALSLEGPDDGPQIEALLDRAFGTDRLKKTSYRYRDGVAPLPDLCLVARERGALVGSIRFWPIRLAAQPALLLGPLAIEPARQNQGIGRALTEASLAKAQAAGWRLVFLVGDPAYYARYGFAPAPRTIVMPGESPARLQFRTLAGAALPPGGGVLLRHGVEPGEQRPLEVAHALVAGHSGFHLADPGGHGAGHGSLASNLPEPPQQRADGEHDRPAFRQATERLALDPQPEQLASVPGGELRERLPRLRVE